MKNTLTIILLAIITYFVIGIGLDKQERRECITWQVYMEEFENYYLTDWQRQQCGLTDNGVVIRNDYQAYDQYNVLRDYKPYGSCQL